MGIQRRKGPIYESSTKVERILRLKGVPSRYLRYGEADVGRPYSFTVERPWAPEGEAARYKSGAQKELIRSVFEDTVISDTSYIVGVGSYPTDHLGMIFGAAICRRALELRLNPLMMGLWNSPLSTQIKGSPDIVVFYSIRADSHATRLEFCRDWLSILDDTFVVVIVGGADPVSFFNNNLNYPLDSALYFRGESGGKNRKR